MRWFALWGCVGVAAAANGTLSGCTDGTTPDCSGNPSPCGYQQGDNSSADGAEGGAVDDASPGDGAGQ